MYPLFQESYKETDKETKEIQIHLWATQTKTENVGGESEGSVSRR